MAEMQAGVARATITPPVGIPMVGFAGRGPAERVHDDLFATALALQSGDVRALILTADLLFSTDEMVAGLREEVGRRTGTAPQSVILCASHTHYGPSCDVGADSPADVAAYVTNLRHLMAGAAQEAFAGLEPVRIGFGTGASEIGVNRRERRPDGEIILGQNPSGPCDREVRVVRLDTAAGEPLAALVNFACHPVSGAHRWREISADYIGTMRAVVESVTGAICLFLQGTAGNINPVEMRHSAEPARRLGTMLGGEVAKVFEGTATAPAESIATATERVELPAMTFLSVEEGERQVASLRAEAERLRGEGAEGGALWWAESRLRRAEEKLDSLRTGAPLPAIPAELNAIRFGDVALATAPGEIFTETGMAVKARSPFPRTLFAAYTNGSIGYVPVPEAYPKGGYEVTHACRVGPEAAGIIRDTALRLLGAVAG